jgi:hypothetical protein
MNDNTILRIKVPAHLYESVKEQLTLSEAKKGTHNLGAGMELVKEKKMKTPKDGMKKMEEVNEVEKVEEGIMDAIRKATDKLFFDMALTTPKGMSEEDRKANIAGCIKASDEKKKADRKLDRDDLIVSCLKSKGFEFGLDGSQRGMSAMGGSELGGRKWEEGKKERTLDELKKAKDMLEMKIKKMEEGL